MKLLALMGSPRKGGNTDRILDEFIRGFRAGGGEAKKVSVGDLGIAPCRALRDCEKTGECPIRDGMEAFVRGLLSADKVALASPIFFYGLPAQLKAVVDRGQAAWARRRLGGPAPEKEVWVILLGATRGANLFQGALLTLKYFFEPLGARIAGELTYRRIDRPGDIARHPTALAEAFSAGKGFASGTGRPGSRRIGGEPGNKGGER